jgi:hypothetical protein
LRVGYSSEVVDWLLRTTVSLVSLPRRTTYLMMLGRGPTPADKEASPTSSSTQPGCLPTSPQPSRSRAPSQLTSVYSSPHRHRPQDRPQGLCRRRRLLPTLLPATAEYHRHHWGRHKLDSRDQKHHVRGRQEERPQRAGHCPPKIEHRNCPSFPTRRRDVQSRARGEEYHQGV